MLGPGHLTREGTAETSIDWTLLQTLGTPSKPAAIFCTNWETMLNSEYTPS